MGQPNPARTKLARLKKSAQLIVIIPAEQYRMEAAD
jgi:hypothetical protein